MPAHSIATWAIKTSHWPRHCRTGTHTTLRFFGLVCCTDTNSDLGDKRDHPPRDSCSPVIPVPLAIRHFVLSLLGVRYDFKGHANDIASAFSKAVDLPKGVENLFLASPSVAAAVVHSNLW